MKGMSRLLLPILLAVGSGVGHGQADETTIDQFNFTKAPPDRTQAALGPANVTDHRFNLTVLMKDGQWRYTGHHGYKGTGEFVLQSDNQQYGFRYSCAYSFQPNGKSYTARWIVPGKKIEIIMSKPGSKR